METIDYATKAKIVNRLREKGLTGRGPRAAVAALVEAVDEIDLRLLEELERAIEQKRRSRHGP